MILNKDYFLVYDTILVIWAVLNVIHGYKKGGIRTILEIASTIVSFIAAFSLCKQVAFMYPLIDTEIVLFTMSVNLILWFFIVLIVAKLICALVIRVFMGKRDDHKVTFLSRILGILLSLIKIGIVYGIIVFLCMSPLVENGNRFINQGPLYYVKEVMIDYREVVGIDV